MRNTVESPTCGGTDSRRPGPRVAIVTCERLPRFAPDDLIAVAALERRGAQVVSCVWSDPEVAWTDFDAVLIRSQPELGGSRRQMIPPPVVLGGSAAVLAQAEASTLYARVDGIVSDGAFRLMELELIEPSLYFDGDGAAAGRFADAALRLVR